MNYNKIYRQIIKNRQENPLHKDEYGENHHIIPRCLGGSDDKNNLVRLSAREHFICHMLLAEMYPKNSNEWYKMNHAFIFMKANSTTQFRYVNNRYYELKKKDRSLIMSNNQSGNNNSQFGTVWVYSLNERKSIRIDKSLLPDYLENGYKLGRVCDWNNFSEQKFCKYKNRQKRVIKHYDEKPKIFFNGKPLKLVNIKYLETLFKKPINSTVEIFNIKAILEKLYIDKSISKIANDLNTRSDTLSRYFKLLQIQIRTHSESLKLSHIGKCRKHSNETKKQMKKTALLIAKQKGEKNSQFGTIWITNGIENKKVKNTDFIPIGFKRGRIKNY